MNPRSSNLVSAIFWWLAAAFLLLGFLAALVALITSNSMPFATIGASLAGMILAVLSRITRKSNGS